MIKKITGLRTTVTKTALAMKELQNLGYTENGIGGAVSCKLNYVNNEDEVVIEVEDFDVESISLYYKAWKEEKYLIHCKECGKVLILENGKVAVKLKYCDSCRYEKSLEIQRKYDQKGK